MHQSKPNGLGQKKIHGDQVASGLVLVLVLVLVPVLVLAPLAMGLL